MNLIAYYQAFYTENLKSHKAFIVLNLIKVKLLPLMDNLKLNLFNQKGTIFMFFFIQMKRNYIA